MEITIKGEPKEIAVLMTSFVEQFNDDFDVEAIAKLLKDISLIGKDRKPTVFTENL